jgi:hypothetical protein
MRYLRSIYALSASMLLPVTLSQAQTGQGEFGVRIQCNVMPAKTAILSSEILQASCIISRDVGHFYVAVDTYDWDVVGVGRWEVDIQSGETKEFHFTVKLSAPPLKQIDERVPLAIRVSRTPFEPGFRDAWSFDKKIGILDFQALTDSANARRRADAIPDSIRRVERTRLWREYLRTNGKRGSIDELRWFNRFQDSLEQQNKNGKPDSASINRKL